MQWNFRLQERKLTKEKGLAGIVCLWLQEEEAKEHNETEDKNTSGIVEMAKKMEDSFSVLLWTLMVKYTGCFSQKEGQRKKKMERHLRRF